MKVMHILDSLNRGGAEMLVLDLCRNARANNLDLTLVATGGGDLEADFSAAGVPFYRFDRRRPVDLKLARQLRGLISQLGINVVHTHQAVEALHAYLATRRNNNVKRVMTFHLCTADAKNKVALNLLVPRMHANVAVSRELLVCLETRAGFHTADRFSVIHNGVDPRRLKPSGPSLRDALGLPQKALLVGMVGNFYPDRRKDQLTICKSLPEFFSEFPQAYVIFAGGNVGSSAEMEACVAFCRESGTLGRVQFLGKRADIPDVLDSLDIYIQSSTNESLGMAVVEAMLAGLPVIVSDINALLEVTGEGKFAVPFRTGDAGDLARKLIALARADHRRAELSRQGRDFALRNFTIEKHISSLSDFYMNLAGSPATPAK